MSSVLLICKQEDAIRGLSDILRSMNFELIDAANSAAKGRRRLQEIEYDLVIVNTPLGDEFGVDMAVDILDQFMCGVVLLVKAEQVEHVEEKLFETAAFVVPKPMNRQLFEQTIHFVCRSGEKFQWLKNQNKALKEKIDHLGVVYRGKLFLMGYLNMTEDQAHRYIQKKAMDMQTSPKRIAEQIVKTYEKK